MVEDNICQHDPESICHKCKKRFTCDEAQDLEVAKVTDCITYEKEEGV